MKKFKSLVLAVIGLLCSLSVSAHDFVVDWIYYNITSSTDMTVEVTYYGYDYAYYSNEYSGAVTIPESVTYNGSIYSVTSIGHRAFYDCSALTSVEIPNSVTSIGYRAFDACSALTSVVIGNSVTSIECAAFSGCSGLTSVVIPNSVTSIEEYAFEACSGLTSVVIPNSVTSIGESAFEACSGLTSLVVAPDNPIYDSREGCNAIVKTSSNELLFGCQFTIIPNSVTSIGSYAFYKCDGLTSVVIPNSVTSIGESAFEGCSGLTYIEIPNSVTSIGNLVFYDCSGLTSVVIPNSVIRIGDWVFRGCSNLTSVVIPNSVSSIGDYAFEGCSSLTSVVIGYSVTSIGSFAFYRCNNLKVVLNNSNFTFKKGSSSYGYIAYYAKVVCNGYEQVDDFIFTEEGGACYLRAYIGDKTELVLPANYKGGNYGIGEYAFYDCDGLTSVMIPNSVTSIGSSAFSNCSSLTKLSCYAKVPPTCGSDVFYGINKETCVLQVPQSCLAAYQQADQWKEFFFIEDVLTAIGGVTVDGAVSATADVYSTNGMLIKRNAELKNLKHELPAGIYIIGGKKVWVK